MQKNKQIHYFIDLKSLKTLLTQTLIFHLLTICDSDKRKYDRHATRGRGCHTDVTLPRQGNARKIKTNKLVIDLLVSSVLVGVKGKFAKP